MVDVYLGLGSNVGDRADYLAKAVDLIIRNGDVVVHKSSIIETPSWGFESTPFLNQVIMIHTKRTPKQLLELLKNIEITLGRVQKSELVENQIKYHDRTIDIDILLYGFEKINTIDLVVPHPEMLKRGFVLIPLREIADQNTLKFINNS